MPPGTAQVEGTIHERRTECCTRVRMECEPSESMYLACKECQRMTPGTA